MLQVTDRAATLLRDIQAEQEESKDKVLRLVSQGGQFELTFDTASENDQVFKSAETSVLLVAPDVAETLADATIDAQDTPEGPRLTLSSGSGASSSE
jgi:Fe-S cluster assembly iron-binding protein IscA